MSAAVQANAAIRIALRDSYPVDQYALLWEVGNGTGSRQSRWADAVAMGLWPSRGLLVEGIEIKVHRHDWLRELKNPAKADEIARYCDLWWIVCTEGVVSIDELPPGWGAKVLNAKGKLQVVQKPVRNENVKPLDRSFVAAMLRRQAEAGEAVIRKAVDDLHQRERSAERKDAERAESQAVSELATLNKRLAELRELTGLDLNHWTPNREVAAALKFALRWNIAGELTGLERVAVRAQKLAAEIRAWADPDAAP